MVCILFSLAPDQEIDKSQTTMKKNFLQIVHVIFNSFIFHIQVDCVRRSQ